MSLITLKAPFVPDLAQGDIITIQGDYNRPRFFSRFWWTTLVFGKSIRALRLAGERPGIIHPCTRRKLFAKRRLHTYRIESVA